MQNKKNFNYQEYEILERVEEAPNIFLFRLKENLSFSPGQFVQVNSPRYGEATYVPCSNPKEKNFFELCIRGCGNTSNQLIKLLPGDKINLRGPYGNGWPFSKLLGHDILIIAGGMGMVPLRPLIYEILRYRREFKKINFVAGFKTDRHILFKEDLIDWQSKFDQFKLCFEHQYDKSFGQKGMITDGIAETQLNPKKTIVLMCGPEIMYSFANEILAEKGIPENNIYISFERRMGCGIGICQHCNIGKYLVCRDGPVFTLAKIKSELGK